MNTEENLLENIKNLQIDFLKSINDYFVLNNFYLIIKVGSSKLFIYYIDVNGVVNEMYCNNF